MYTEKTKAGYKEGVVSVVVNALLFGLKLWAGIVTGSIALTADAWHTLSDSLSSIIVIVGVRLSTQKPDKEHPFGHGRWEQIAALFIGFFLSIIAYDFLKSSIEQFSSHEATTFGTLAIVVTLISIVVKEGLAQYAFYLGRKTDNAVIKADSWHHRSDALSSVMVLVGILFASHFWWIDSVLGILISFMLFYAMYEILKQSVGKLLGETPSEELIRQIEIEIKKTCNVDFEPHHYHMHNYVSHQELTFHIRLDSHMDIATGHQIASQMEKVILDKFNIVATVHIEPKS